MAVIVAKRRLRFEDGDGSHTAIPRPHPQSFPDRFLGDPYFQSAVECGWLQRIDQPESEPAVEAPEAPVRRRKRADVS